jgi:AraC-like DNA-binding protein
VGEKNELIHSLFRSFYSELRQTECPPKALLRNYLSLILLEYESALAQRQQVREPDLVLPRVADYINLHYRENLRIEEIAAAYNYNPVYFGRLFQKYYGQSLKNYVIDLRLTCAAELLETTDYTVEEVALQSGFGNKLQFYNKFKERFGDTPKEYKTRLRLQDNRLALVHTAPNEPNAELTPFHWNHGDAGDERLYEFTAKDSSMTAVGIYPGDRVIVGATDRVEQGALVAVKVPDGAITARRISVLSGEKNYILHACTDDKQNHPDLYVSDPQMFGIIRFVLHDPKNSLNFR